MNASRAPPTSTGTENLATFVARNEKMAVLSQLSARAARNKPVEVMSPGLKHRTETPESPQRRLASRASRILARTRPPSVAPDQSRRRLRRTGPSRRCDTPSLWASAPSPHAVRSPSRQLHGARGRLHRLHCTTSTAARVQPGLPLRRRLHRPAVPRVLRGHLGRPRARAPDLAPG